MVSASGDNGWYFGTFLWKMRGLLDELCGGGACPGPGHVAPWPLATPGFLGVVEVEDCRRCSCAPSAGPGEALLDFRSRAARRDTSCA